MTPEQLYANCPAGVELEAAPVESVGEPRTMEFEP